jgi:hypothetical protein
METPSEKNLESKRNYGVQYSIVNATIVSLLFIPTLIFINPRIDVELLEESTVGEYHMTFEVSASREVMYEMFAVNNKVFKGGDRTLKEVEMWEDNGDHWIVRHRYAVGFAFFKDWTDMVLEFNAIPGLEYDEVSWHLYRSMDGKILATNGHYRIYEGEQGGAEVHYWSRTEYASRRPVVAFALRNFSESLLKATFRRMVETLE